MPNALTRHCHNLNVDVMHAWSHHMVVYSVVAMQLTCTLSRQTNGQTERVKMCWLELGFKNVCHFGKHTCTREMNERHWYCNLAHFDTDKFSTWILREWHTERQSFGSSIKKKNNIEIEQKEQVEVKVTGPMLLVHPQFGPVEQSSITGTDLCSWLKL